MIKTKLVRYNKLKEQLAKAESDLLKELNKQLDKNKLKINKVSPESLELTEDGGVVFNYRIVNYDESEPAQLELK